MMKFKYTVHWKTINEDGKRRNPEIPQELLQILMSYNIIFIFVNAQLEN